MLWPPAWNSWLKWHHAGMAPNEHPSWTVDWRRRAWPRVIPGLSNITEKEQRQLFDKAWFILQKHNVSGDDINYVIALELANEISSLRDRQRGKVLPMRTSQENRQQ